MASIYRFRLFATAFKFSSSIPNPILNTLFLTRLFTTKYQDIILATVEKYSKPPFFSINTTKVYMLLVMLPCHLTCLGTNLKLFLLKTLLILKPAQLRSKSGPRRASISWITAYLLTSQVLTSTCAIAEAGQQMVRLQLLRPVQIIQFADYYWDNFCFWCCQLDHERVWKYQKKKSCWRYKKKSTWG